MSSPFPTLYRHLSYDKLDSLDFTLPHPLLRTLSTDSQTRSISRGLVDLTRNTSTGFPSFQHLSNLDTNIVLPTFESRFIADSNKFQSTHTTYPITSASSFSSTTSIPTTDTTPFRTPHSSTESLSDSDDTDEDMDHITNTRITQLQSMLATRLQDVEIHRTHVTNYQSITERMTNIIQQQQEVINQLLSRCGMEYKYETTRANKRTRISMEQDGITNHLTELHNNMNSWEQTYTSIMSHITSSSNDTSSPIPRVKSEYGAATTSYGTTSKQVKGGREAIPLISTISPSPCLTLTCPIELDAKAESSAPPSDERIIRVMGSLNGEMYIPATDLFPLMGVAKRSVSSYLANYPLTERARMAVQCQRKTGHTLMTEVNVLTLDGIRRMFTSIQRPHTDKLRRWLESEINRYRTQISPDQEPVMMGDGATSLTATRTRISPKRKIRDE